jgi:hypothetical protein
MFDSPRSRSPRKRVLTQPPEIADVEHLEVGANISLLTHVRTSPNSRGRQHRNAGHLMLAVGAIKLGAAGFCLFFLTSLYFPPDMRA